MIRARYGKIGRLDGIVIMNNSMMTYSCWHVILSHRLEACDIDKPYHYYVFLSNFQNLEVKKRYTTNSIRRDPLRKGYKNAKTYTG
jgi:hypothetical protein